MKETEISPPFIQTYSPVFRLQAHLLLAWGYEQAQTTLATQDEEEITDALYEQIQMILLLEEEAWMVNYAAKNEDPITGGKRKGKKRREIDLIIEFTGRGRPQYVFEAKVLNWRKRYQRTDNYTSESGMGRFLEGEYADYTARFPEVGMLGYVLSDSLPEWQARLKKAVDDRSEQLGLHLPQKDVAVCEHFPLEWVTVHQRNSADTPLTIYHILLDCM